MDSRGVNGREEKGGEKRGEEKEGGEGKPPSNIGYWMVHGSYMGGCLFQGPGC